jgi:hypothetical protein
MKICICMWGKGMIWAEAVPRGNHRKGLVLPRQAATRPFRLDRSRVIRQACREGTALSGVSVVVAQDAAEALPTMHRAAPAADLACGSRKPRRPAGSKQQGPVVMYGNEPTRRGCSDGAIRRPGGRPLPGWRAGVARAGGRSSWWTRCGCGDKHSFGPRRRAVNRINGPMAKEPQALSAWAFAVGLSILSLRGHGERRDNGRHR